MILIQCQKALKYGDRAIELSRPFKAAPQIKEHMLEKFGIIFRIGDEWLQQGNGFFPVAIKKICTRQFVAKTRVFWPRVNSLLVDIARTGNFVLAQINAGEIKRNLIVILAFRARIPMEIFQNLLRACPVFFDPVRTGNAEMIFNFFTLRVGVAIGFARLCRTIGIEQQTSFCAQQGLIFGIGLQLVIENAFGHIGK